MPIYLSGTPTLRHISHNKQDTKNDWLVDNIHILIHTSRRVERNKSQVDFRSRKTAKLWQKNTSINRSGS